MAKYLIEVPHEANKVACERAIQVFLSSGSHFLVNAEWGCGDGEHKAWMIVDVENREQARLIVPPFYRPETKIVVLNRWRLGEGDEVLPHHER
jgi:RES domain-containing protein